MKLTDIRDFPEKSAWLKMADLENMFEVSVDKYGMIAALTRISDKFNRIENLILTGDNGTDDEAITDTLIDMANYCVMTAVYMKNVGGKSDGKNN